MAKVRNQQIRLDFLEKCFNHLVKYGLENASLRDLCKGTGISSGSLYYWFGSKEGLLLEATQYGLSLVSDNIFQFVFEHINDPTYFFENFIRHIDTYRMELRYIYQVATSPKFGAAMNIQAISLNSNYYNYSRKLCKEYGGSESKIRSIIFLVASIISDYAVWGDLVVTQEQLDYVRTLLESELNIK